MSRIGKAPIEIPAGVTVNVNADNVVTVKGPKGELSQAVNPEFESRLRMATSSSTARATTASTAHSTVFTVRWFTTWLWVCRPVTAKKWN